MVMGNDPTVSLVDLARVMRERGSTGRAWSRFRGAFGDGTPDVRGFFERSFRTL